MSDVPSYGAAAVGGAGQASAAEASAGATLNRRTRTGVSGWDTNTAAGAIVFGALAFLVLVRHGFRGITSKVGG